MALGQNDAFSDFLHAFDKATIVALIPIIAVPFLLDQLFSLQPPWPQYSTYTTAFLELCTLFLAFFIRIESRKKLFRYQIAAFTLICVMFLAYFSFYSMFVFEVPLTGEKVVSGFRCTHQAERFIAPALMQECPFLNEEALAAAGYEVEIVWTPFSVRLMEIVMFVVWSAFFILATFLFGISVAHLQRSRKAHRHADARHGAADPPGP